MQTFKTYLKVLLKYKIPLLIYGATFLGITIVITHDIKNTKIEQFSVQKIPVLVVNRDGQSEFTDGFLKYLEQYVSFADIKDNEEARKDALFCRKVDYILTIPEGFTDAFLTGQKISLTKEIVPDSAEAMSVDNNINNYLNTIRVYKKYLPEADQKQLNTYVSQALERKAEVAFSEARVDEKRFSDEYNRYYFNYLGYIIMAVFIIGVGMVMLSFQKVDIMRRHNAAPITVKSMNLQLILGNLVFVMIYLVVFLIAGYLFNPFRRVDTNLVLYWINAFIFALTALSISYLVGICVKSRNAVSAISTAVSLCFAFPSGIFVPQELLGAAVFRAASFTPTYWYVKANDTIENLTSYRWNNISGILGMMTIQIGFAAAIISVSLVISKRKRQRTC